VVAAVSLGVRAIVLSEQLAANPMLREAVLDDAAYIAYARAFAVGETRTWFLAPLYPWLLACAGRAFELGLPLACWINALFGGATSAALALTARAFHSAAAGWLAGGLHALLGSFVFLDVTPGQEPVLCLLHIAALAAALRLARTGDAASAAALGMTAGIAMLGRATSVALLLGALPGLWRAPGARPRLRCAPGARPRLWCAPGARRAGAAAALALGLLAPLLPAALANGLANGDFNPLPWGGGPVMYFANGPDSRRSVSYLATRLGARPEEIEQRALALAAAAEGRPLGPRETSAWWLRETWRSRGSTAELAAHVGRKALLFLGAEERGSTHAVTLERDFSPWLRLSPVHAWWIFSLGAAGWWLLRRRLTEVDAAAWMVAGTWLLLALAFPLARYRLPVAAVALVPLAAGALELRSGGASRARLIGAGALAALFALAAFVPLREPEAGLAEVNLAGAHLRVGDDPALARERLDRVLGRYPDHGPAHELLGRMLLDEAPDRAFAHFSRAAADARTRTSSQIWSVLALVESGHARAAQRLAESLLREVPADPMLLSLASVAAWSSGERAAAAGYLARARRLAPGSPWVDFAARRTGL
jgi:hypothetical protein